MEIETKPMEEYPPVAPSNPVHKMMEINRLKESKAKAMQSLTEIYEHLKTNIEANIETFNDAINKCNIRMSKMFTSMITQTLHNFGLQQF